MRVSYLPFNLTHWHGHAAPEPLEPDRRYRIRVPLKHCGHRFAAGHRIRLAVSTAYWPVIWPSPEAARVTLHLEACRLVLPVRAATPEDSHHEPSAPPTKLPGVPMRQAPESHTQREVLADGARLLTFFDDFGEREDPVHGLSVHSHVRQSYAIRPEDPLSARCQTNWCFTLSRGDWRVRIDSENEMTSTRDRFRLTRRVAAYDGETRIIDRQWEESVPRDHV